MRKERAVAICFDRGSVLVIRRRKGGRRYTVLPGGGIEDGEDPFIAAVRELAEETGLSGTMVRHLTSVDHPDRTAHYFLLNVTPSRLTLGGPEADLQSTENHYSPSWIPITQLDTEPIVPEEVRAIIREAARGEIAAQPTATPVAPPRRR